MAPIRSVRIALVGDYDPTVLAHKAIPIALARAGADAGVAVEPAWLHTATLRSGVEETLARFAAVWCVPASPYADTEAAIAAIRFAREAPRPFLGTCGGFQHALLEYARNVLGLATAQHAELDPAAADPLIAPLSCPLVEKSARITFVAGSLVATAYGSLATVEEYHCSYGLAPSHQHLFDTGPLRVTGRDDAGEVRAVELDGHPFFVATLFQSERGALIGTTPPIVRALVYGAIRSQVSD